MSAQLDLVFNARNHARRSDPATSQSAAVRAEKFAQSHAGRIHAALLEHGPKSAHELEQYTGLNYVQIDRRFVDLRRLGKVVATGVTATTPSGGKAIVWAAVR